MSLRENSKPQDNSPNTNSKQTEQLRGVGGNMESASALFDLQNNVSQLEARLNLLVEWIYHKFADDPSLPGELLTAATLINFTIDYDDKIHRETSSNLNGQNEECQAGTSSHQQPNRRKQIISSRVDFEKIPLDSIKDEVCDEREMIRVVDMNSILNPSEVQLPLLRSRTRQAYVCTTCNRKFRSSAVLDIHKMSHCYVRITSLDSVTTQVLQPEDHADSDMDAESCHSNNDDADFDVQQIQNDTELLHSDDSNDCTTSVSRKKIRKFSSQKTRQNRGPAKAKPNVGDFVCCVCQKKYAKERYLKQHMRLFHREAYDAELAQLNPKYTCNTCQQQFTNKILFKRHRAKFHQEELKAEKAKKGRRCTICKNVERYATTTLLKKHKAEVHGIPDKRKTVKYKCEECNSTFVSRGGFLHHNKAIHMKIRPYMCAVCGKTFAKRFELRSHEDIHSEIKKYTCSHCSKSFRQKVGLDIHVKRHFKSKNQVQCFQCGQFFVSLECLKNHRLEVHEGVRAHACSKCDKRFKKKTHLNYHLKTHDKPNGRKRGLNKEREVLPKREPNKLLVHQTTEEHNFPDTSSAEIDVDQSTIAPRDTEPV